MKNKLFLAILAVLGVGALLTPSLAQSQGNLERRPGLEVSPIVDKKIDIGTSVKLQCRVGGPSEFPTITITNNTNYSIPPGKKLYWQANATMKGSIVLSARLGPGQSVQTSAEAAGTSYNPVAWYFQ
jgi:hypothetical protein